MIRTAWTILALIVGTLLFGSIALLAQLLGVAHKPGSVYEWATASWARWLLGAGGVRVVRHGGDELPDGAPRVFVANHVSAFDIPVCVAALPPYGFLAKRELQKVPLFGAAARAVGVIFIDRGNRKAAFDALDDASRQVREGRSVLVYPEGTRGDGYALRPFKKGSFVLAIGADVPIVPVVIHGTIAVNPNGTLSATPGVVHVHILPPIATVGLSYEERDRLAERVQHAMADCLRTQYGVDPAIEPPAYRAAPSVTPALAT